nr:sporulation protein YjcZ [Paenibacillus taihuensis]
MSSAHHGNLTSPAIILVLFILLIIIVGACFC